MAYPTGLVGAKLYTSATPMVDIDGSADAVGDFTALTIATQIGLIDGFGEFGRAFETVPWTELATGRKKKFKGGFDDGSFEITVAADLNDAGQAALRGYANALDQLDYPFKITYLGADPSNDTFYFAGKVMKFRRLAGNANSILRASILIEINTLVYPNAT